MISDKTTDPEALAELGARLRAHRIAQRLTAAQLATRAGISNLTLLKAEQGGNPTVNTLLRIFRALGRMDLADAIVPAPPASPIAELERERARPRVPQRVRKRRSDG